MKRPASKSGRGVGLMPGMGYDTIVRHKEPVT